MQNKAFAYVIVLIICMCAFLTIVKIYSYEPNVQLIPKEAQQDSIEKESLVKLIGSTLQLFVNFLMQL